jgi:transcriptional repressor NrdR
VADFRDELDRLERELPDEGQLPLLQESRGGVEPQLARAGRATGGGKDK